nr:hypothetical protein [Frankia sp. ArI3]
MKPRTKPRPAVRRTPGQPAETSHHARLRVRTRTREAPPRPNRGLAQPAPHTPRDHQRSQTGRRTTSTRARPPSRTGTPPAAAPTSPGPAVVT